VTNAVIEWLLMRKEKPEQASLFDVETIGEMTGKLEADWKSAAEREKASRSRFAQRTIRPEEVAKEVLAIRETLGRADEVREFTEQALAALEAVLRRDDEGFTADLSGTPAGLRDAVAPVVGGDAVESGRTVPFRTTSAVARGEAALVRTDPVVGAIAGYVLNAALDDQLDGHRPARRCGVIRTRAVDVRTTLLLVRYRFHLTLPSRVGERQLVAEDARLLAFQGAPAKAVWLGSEDALALADLTADENTDREFAVRTMTRVLDALGETKPHLEEYGDQLAAELLESHRGARRAASEIVRGVNVVAQKPADILGAYVYLPVSGGAA